MDVSGTTPPPPLTRWQSTRRYLFASVFGTGAAVFAYVEDYERELSALLVLDLVLGIASLILMHWRRRYPVPVALTTITLGLVSSAGSGAQLVTFMSLSTRRRLAEIVPVGIVSLFSTIGYTWIHGESLDLVESLAFGAIGIGMFSAFGMYVGARRDLAATRREQADLAEREEVMRSEHAQVAERTRIAREMHDVLGHRLSLVAMHAGALAYRRELSDAEVVEAADVIRTNAHQALTDLREILGVLRMADTERAPQRPQPTLSDLPALVDEAVGAGTRVRLRNEFGDLTEAPETIGRSAYRMIQEALTNARKHAPDTNVEVVLSRAPSEVLVIEVRNPVRVGAAVSRTPGSGLGLIGLTERAELIGGSLEHGVSDGSFVVRARLPWPV